MIGKVFQHQGFLALIANGLLGAVSLRAILEDMVRFVSFFLLNHWGMGLLSYLRSSSSCLLHERLAPLRPYLD